MNTRLLPLVSLLWLTIQASAATYTVTNTNDAGAGSLSKAIVDANNNAVADVMTFAAPTIKTGTSTISAYAGTASMDPLMTINDVTQNELGVVSTFQFTVSLSAPAPAGGVSFDIATANNTATTADNDYVLNALIGRTIPAGNSTFTFNVTVIGDATFEPDETFFVNITNVTGALVTDAQGLGTITNDDASCPSGSVLYVNANATGANNGSSWTDAFTNLQDALTFTNTCTSITQIWVAAGTYFPDEGGAAVNNDRNASFRMKNNLAIYGGFSGTETSLSQRDWIANKTILSGEIQQDNDVSNNSLNVILNAYLEAARLYNTAILDGFTVTGGNANGTKNVTIPSGSVNIGIFGGGISNVYASPTIANCIFTGNSAQYGGGFASYYSYDNLSMVNCSFLNNSAGQNGGGLYLFQTTPSFSGVLFLRKITVSNNSSGYGGGVYIADAQVGLENSVVSTNSASSGGGGIFSYGSSVSLFNSTVYGNTTSSSSFYSGGLYFGTDAPTRLTIVNSIFWGNRKTGNVISSVSYGGSESELFNSATYSDIERSSGVYAGIGNINQDPLFVNAADPDGADNVFGTADDGLALQNNSPARNTGTATNAPTTDILGNNRVGNPDMGAYENIAPPGPTASVLSVNGSSTICRGNSANLIVTITGGTSPYTVVYSDGTNNFTVPGYTSGANIPVSPTVSTTYSLVSVTDAGAIAGTGNSGTPTITVTDPPTWYLDADGDGYYVSSTQSCTSPGAGYTTTIGLPGDCNDDPNAGGAAIHAPVQYYVDADHDGFGSTSTEMVCSLTATIGYSTNNTDCDDANTDVWQSALLYIDADGDGYDGGQEPVCYGAAIPAGYKTTTLGTDCNDSDPGTLVVSVGSTCRLVYAGYDAASNSTVLTATASGQGSSGYTYLWSNGATTPSITVSPATTTIYSVTASKLGCSATAAVTVNVINVACEKNKVLVCHKGQTLCVSKTGKNGVADHLAHGDKLGSCDTELPCGSANSRVAAYEPAIEAPAEGWLAYPNPFEQTLTLQLHAATAGSADIVLVDMVGRSVVSKKQLLVEGPNRIVLETGRVAPGVYIVQLTDAASVVRTLKVLKK